MMSSLEKVWPEWKIEKQIGKGSFGIVYQAVRQDSNMTSHAAIKVISITMKNIVKDFVNEIRLMESVKGIQNIVSIEDFKVVERTDETGWDIYIRMELLIPFNVYICDKKLTEREVIRLGCDICSALEICRQRNIIHRNIKPENIFINDFGSFKLGGFGIARTMENLTCGLPQRGSYNYMAPEVMNGKEYDARVDVYSLGLVLYRLMNGNRLPFISEKQILSSSERQNAFDRRIHGEALPAPCEATCALTDVILRACAFNPKDRFASAAELRQALLQVSDDSCQVSCNHVQAVDSEKARSDSDVSVKNSNRQKKSENAWTKYILPLSIVFMLLLLCGGGVLAVMSKSENPPLELAVRTGAAPTDYMVGDTLQTDGIILDVKYSDGREESLRDGFTCSPAKLTEEGPQNISVFYKGKSATFQVNVFQTVTFKDLVVKCTSSGNTKNGDGYNIYGMPVNWLLYLKFDLTEEMQSRFKPVITCSWDHVVNGNGYWEEEGDFTSAKNGMTYCESDNFYLDRDNEFEFLLFLPDDSSIEGEQTVTLQVGSAKKTISFTLIYAGDYDKSIGWIIRDIEF